MPKQEAPSGSVQETELELFQEPEPEDVALDGQEPSGADDVAPAGERASRPNDVATAGSAPSQGDGLALDGEEPSGGDDVAPSGGEASQGDDASNGGEASQGDDASNGGEASQGDDVASSGGEASRGDDVAVVDHEPSRAAAGALTSQEPSPADDGTSEAEEPSYEVELPDFEAESASGLGASDVPWPASPAYGQGPGPSAPASEPPPPGVAARSSQIPLSVSVKPVGPEPGRDGAAEPSQVSRPLRLLAVSGAKGGVGKTVLAANLALYLATIGRRVVLVDADPTGPNLHTCLGTRPGPPLQRTRQAAKGNGRQGGRLSEEVFANTPFAGLRLMRMGVVQPAAGGARGPKPAKLLPKLRTVDAHYVVIDLGDGTSKDVLDAYLSADLSLFVTAPEPTAIENTYRFLRAAFARFLLSRVVDPEGREDLSQRLRSMGGAPPPLDLMKSLRRENHPLADSVGDALTGFQPRVVINQTRLRADLELGYAMRSAARRRLGITIDYLGHIDSDDTVWSCVRSRRPLLLESPGTKSSKKIEKIARRLLMIEAGKDPSVRPPTAPVDTHHDLLEVERGATDEEIRRAFKRCRDIYAPHSQCCYGLFEPNELEKLLVRIDEAFDVLLDPARRRPYELSAFAADPDPNGADAPNEADAEPPPPAPEISPDTHFTGTLLRRVRLSQRVQLQDVSRRTKIGVGYLKAIEDEDFGVLPPLVYTRGFVGEFAKYLKLDSQQVSRTYVRRYKDYLEQRGKLLCRDQKVRSRLRRSSAAMSAALLLEYALHVLRRRATDLTAESSPVSAPNFLVAAHVFASNTESLAVPSPQRARTDSGAHPRIRIPS